MLWGEDERYPKRIYPAASCLDSELPRELATVWSLAA